MDTALILLIRRDLWFFADPEGRRADDTTATRFVENTHGPRGVFVGQRLDVEAFTAFGRRCLVGSDQVS